MGTKTNIVVSGINIAVYIDSADLGFTQDGVAIAHKTDYIDIEADQSINILGKKKIKETCQIKVNVEEATLANIKIAMGEENSISDDGSWKRLSFGGGVNVTEHLLRFEGLAPGTDKVRKFHVYKAVSIDIGETSYKKGDKTLIPITFEAIADTTKPAGEQYGYYEDQV
jgi:hypothetical protein